jgi:4-azaleucine resistance transporter AzlC
MRSRHQEFLSGIQAELPLLLGVIPFGLIYGYLAISAGIQPAPAQAMSALVFGGSSQIIATQLVGNETPSLVIVLTIAIVNLRHALYSASIAPYVQNLKATWKWLLAYLLTDEAYAVTITHYQQGSTEVQDPNPQSNPHWFFLGAGLALWSTWQASTAMGVFIGAEVPESWSLDFTLALSFIALVVPNLKDRAAVAAALSAGVIAVVAYSLPYHLGLVAAALVGILVGLWAEGRK